MDLLFVCLFVVIVVVVFYLFFLDHDDSNNNNVGKRTGKMKNPFGSPFLWQGPKLRRVVSPLAFKLSIDH